MNKPPFFSPESLQKPIDEEEPIEDAYGIEELEDGSAIVSFGEDEVPQESPEFGENMAETLDAGMLATLGRTQAELIESDRRAREGRDKQYADGIKKTGLGNESPGGADFAGASRVTHPMMAKGCVDFASRAIKELFPASGPCKTQIVGESDDVKLDKAERKKTYMNWQMTTQVSEQRTEFERLLSQLPLGGSQYKRWWWDAALERPRTEVVYIDDVFFPYSQADFYSSYRVTHRQWVSANEYDERIESGLYRDLNLAANAPGMSETSLAKRASDKIEGNQEDSAAYNDEGLREIYLCYVDLKIEDDTFADGRTAPYILHIENTTQQVLGLYRNWDEDDERCIKKQWMVEYIFIPWRGAYGVGLYHLIGSLSGSGTGALRALLDSANFANFPGALKLKSGRAAGQSIAVNPTEIAEIDIPTGINDIRKAIMPFPFAGPSPVLFSLLEWLTQQAESVIATASEKIADAGANMPVGTALALIEHGSVNFSAIHARCHASLKRELEILHRLNAENISDEETVDELGSLVVSRKDFQGPMDIIPVSDPNIFSEAQRYAQLQAVMQLAADPGFQPYFKKDRLLQRALRLLQISSPEDLADLPKDPKRLGPVDENYTVGSPEPSPLKVYTEQDDVAHLEAHLHFLVSPMFGANPLIGTAVYGLMMPHVKDHLMAFYKKHAKAAADAMEMMAPAMGQQITRAQAEAKGAAFADQTMANILGPMVMPALEQAQKLADQFAPKPPVDPTVQAQIAGQQALEMAKAQSAQALETLRLQAEGQKAMAAMGNDDKERAHKQALQALELDYKTQSDAATRDQNDRATTMATALEDQQLKSAERIAAGNMQAQIERDQAAQQHALELQRLRDTAAAQNLVLAKGLETGAVVQEGPQLVDVIQPLIAEMQASNAAMVQRFQEGFQTLHASHRAPRTARYIKDENGKNIGVESVENPVL